MAEQLAGPVFDLAVFEDLVEHRTRLEVAFHDEGRCTGEHFATHYPPLKRACDALRQKIARAMQAGDQPESP